eukprot:7913383-Pyramimonas_sp.AAC.1
MAAALQQEAELLQYICMHRYIHTCMQTAWAVLKDRPWAVVGHGDILGHIGHNLSNCHDCLEGILGHLGIPLAVRPILERRSMLVLGHSLERRFNLHLGQLSRLS